MNRLTSFSGLMLIACLNISLIGTVANAAETQLTEAREGDSQAPGLALFKARIAELLETHCLSCHNSTDAKGGLHLTTLAGGLTGGESGPAIVPGEPDSSYLLDLLTPHEGKAAMPKGAEPLSAEEIQLFREWIEQGAQWPENRTLVAEKWWSLKPLAQPDVPKSATVLRVDGNPFEIRTPIDAFIAQTYQKLDLKPVQQADRQTLIRRVYSDLIGLPPTPAEIQAFVNDPASDAYEQLVDRLMAMPEYGERQAQHWLDVVKYADSCGYDKDQPRPHAWPYRDYVIRSLNQDKPYSRFVQEQIAGDVLFPGQADGILGLGFIAAGPWDLIGHVEVAEDKIDGKIARMLDRDDMVSSVMNTFTSMTVQCARCHDHKFDPITQAQYFGLQAVFAAVDRANRVYYQDPQIEQQRQKSQLELAEVRQKIQSIEHELQAAADGKLTELETRVAELRQLSVPVNFDPRYGYHSEISSSQESLKWVQIELPQPTLISQIVLQPCYDDFNQIGAGFGFPVRFRILGSTSREHADDPHHFQVLADYSQQDQSNPGLKPVQISFDSSTNPATYRVIRIEVSKLSPRQNDFIFSLAEVAVLSHTGENVALGATVQALDSIESGQRWSARNLTDGIFATTGDQIHDDELFAAQSELDGLKSQLYTPEILQQLADLNAREATIQQDIQRLPEGLQVFAASTHFPSQGNFRATSGIPREIRILNRGEVQSPGSIAIPGSIPVIEGAAVEFELLQPDQEGERRAELAKWVTRHDNPLTWRSIVNRLWQSRFSNGLVTSPNDFGRMGQLPTHPELLDWLAAEFRDHGQSLKSLHRLILLSSVYQLSSESNSENLALDSTNQFLWRMNRRRLDAEEIRDATLAVAGCLDHARGGPGFYLFVIEKPEHSPHYQYQLYDPADASTHRRSVYRFVVRSQPDPYLTTLDCADSTQSTPQRTETVTALQSLSLMNSRFNLHMSEEFSKRLSRDFQQLDEQVAGGFELATGRPPSPEEQSDLLEYAHAHGLSNLCRILLNLSEFVYVD